MDQEFGSSKCKLLYTEWIHNKILLYSTGKYIQYPFISHKGKKKCIYVYTHTQIYVCVKSVNCSVISDSLQLHELQPTRLLCPWNSPGKNTGVGCHFLLPPQLQSRITRADIFVKIKNTIEMPGNQTRSQMGIVEDGKEPGFNIRKLLRRC